MKNSFVAGLLAFASAYQVQTDELGGITVALLTNHDSAGWLAETGYPCGYAANGSLDIITCNYLVY